MPNSQPSADWADARVVVVGGGLGGIRTAERLRAEGLTGPITIVGDEPRPPYNRPPLTKEFLRGSIDDQRLAVPLRRSVADVEWRLGISAQHIDLSAHTVTLADGASVSYEGLVVATGVRPRSLAWTDRDGSTPRFSVRTVDDATRLAAALRPGRRVCILGAGFMGSEIAATATELGCVVSVVDPLPGPLHGPLGGLVADTVRRRHEEHGVEFHLGRRPCALTTETTGVHTVTLDDGSTIAADVIVEAVGSVANTALLDGQGLDLTNGILCDADLHPVRGEATVAEAVVVGDVARVPLLDFTLEPVRVEHWTMPTEMARHAARSLLAGIAGRPTPAPRFAPIPTFWTELYDVRLQALGLPHLGTDVRLLEGSLDDRGVVGYHDDRGHLLGVLLIDRRDLQADYHARLVEARSAAAAR